MDEGGERSGEERGILSESLGERSPRTEWRKNIVLPS